MNEDPKTLAKKYTPKLTTTVEQDRQVTLIRFSPNGEVLVGGGYDGQVRRWDSTGEELTELAPLKGHDGWVSALTFAGGKLLSADTWGRLCCWSDPTAKEAKPTWQVANAHNGWIRQLSASPDGKQIATCGRDGCIRLWSVADGKKLRDFGQADSDVYSLAFHPDGKSLVTGDLFGVVKQWNLESGQCEREFDAKKMHKYDRIQDIGGVRCLFFDKAGKTLIAAGSEPTRGASVTATPLALFFDWGTGKEQAKILGKASDGFIFDMHLHPAGFAMMATSGQPGNGKVHFQRPEDAQPFFTGTKMANCHAIAIDPKGQRIVVAATNKGSNGNGRRLTKEMEYAGNWSPLHVWQFTDE